MLGWMGWIAVLCTVGWIASHWVSAYAHRSGSAFEYLLDESTFKIAKTSKPNDRSAPMVPPFIYPNALHFDFGQGLATPLHWQNSGTAKIDIPVWTIAVVAWASFGLVRSLAHIKGRKERLCIHCGATLKARSETGRCPNCGH